MSEFYFIKQSLTSESGFSAAQQDSLHAIFQEFTELVEDMQEEIQMLRDRVDLLEEA